MTLTNKVWNIIKFSIYVPFYDFLAILFYKQRKQSIEMLKPKTDEKILIVGAGTGLDLMYLKNNRDITAIDITPGMVLMLKLRAKILKLKVKTHIMDGEHLKFPDNTFDSVILHLILTVVPHPQKCFAEVYRVLKPDGKIIIFDKFLPKDSKKPIWRKIINIFVNFIFSDINIKFEEIFFNNSLTIVEDKNVIWGNFFRIIKIKKNVN